MLWHRLSITFDDSTYSAIVEVVPGAENNDAQIMYVWIKDFGLPADHCYAMRPKLRAWLQAQGYRAVFSDSTS